MCLEPLRSPRLATLARLAAAEPILLVDDQDIKPTSMTALPSTPLARAVASCPDCHARVTPAGVRALCDRHEAVWRFEQVVGAAAAPMAEDVGRELMDAFRRQASALNMVWEAHLRGAVRLPEEVTELVRAARERAPDFLAGSPLTRTA